jgi:Zn-dependent protease with chaperone function
MDRDEIQFILGHEMGHVKPHTMLNTLVVGRAYKLPGAAAVMELAFRWWNRHASTGR